MWSRQLVRMEGFTIERAAVDERGTAGFAEATMRIAPSALLVDSYAYRETDFVELVELGPPVAAFDDLCAFPFSCRLGDS